MLLGQRRHPGLQVEQAAQLAAIGHAPVALPEAPLAVHRRDEIQRLLPGEGKFGGIGAAGPDQPSQPVEDFVTAHLESRLGPRHADGERGVLARTCARHRAAVVGVAGALASVQIMPGGHD